MSNTPGQRAQSLVHSADAYFRRGKIKLADQTLQEAFGLKNKVENYSGNAWISNHHDFTSAMLDMAVLRYKLGQFKQGNHLAEYAQAWADDPNCSNQQNFEQSFSVRKYRILHFFSGLFGWIRAAVPA